ncbi:M23 family metallopeptidase [Micromonospora sp. NPDC049240]|uniref:M23 family metallopeptidase n=1 Tax=Micromonospora sp. NPDC049240 TaxID=3155151 RepID=UPI0033EC844C
MRPQLIGRRVAVVNLVASLIAMASALAPASASAATDGDLWWPSNGTVTGTCGEPRPTHTHKGTDIARSPSTEVYAAYDGTVRWNAVGADPAGYGNYLDVVHANGWSTRYAHLRETPTAPLVPNGATVSRGQLIGHTAVNGDSTGLHVHFEILKNGAFQCSANAGRGTVITAKTRTSINIGATSGAEPVTNGAGVHITGPNSYTDVSSTGQVYAWNGGYFGGSPTGYSGRFTDAKVTSDGAGYWLLTSIGQIYAYGNAPYKGGSPTGYSGEIVAMAATPDNQGYVMLSATGQVYAYGTPYRGGSPGGYSGSFVDIEMTPDGGGYWLLTSMGQVYAYGNAAYLGGSPTGFSRAIVAMSRTSDGLGYVLVSKAGQIYAYGNAQYQGGSPAGITGEIADVSYRTDGQPGYVMVSTTGQHYAYNTPFLGNPTGASGVF